MITIHGYGTPDTKTAANVNDVYIDLESNVAYRCTDVNVAERNPHGYIQIGDYSIDTCEYIWEAMTAPGGDTVLTSLIEGTATSLEVPEGVTNIGQQALSHTPGLRTISLPEGLETIGAYAFENCTALESINIPESLTTIGDHAFYYSTALKSVSFPEEMEELTLNEHAFGMCSLSSINLPKGLKIIGDSAFYSGFKMENLIIPETVTSVGNNAFINCTLIKTVTFKGKPNTVNSYAFRNDTGITTINVPWASGAVSGAPWGATKATINYNYTG